MGRNALVGETELTVFDPAVHEFVLYYSSPDSMDVADVPGRVLLVHARAGQPNDPPPDAPGVDAFSLVTDEESFQGRADARSLSQYPGGYATESPNGWVAFELPAPLGVDTASVTVGDARWTVPEPLLERLNRDEPSWRLESVTLPDRLVEGERFAVQLQVRNTSAVPGVFRGALNVAGVNAAYAPHPFAREADSGETAVFRHTDTAPEAGRSVGLHLRTTLGDEDRLYEVESAGPPTPTPTDSQQ
jgi:hypothetical protein